MTDDRAGARADGLTVGEAAAQLGVSVRALHHWDATGLAVPSLRTAAGYRLYTAEDLRRLQRISIYRQLGVPLATIRSMLDDASTDPAAALRAQRRQLDAQIARLHELGTGLDRMIEAHEHGALLTAGQQAAIFGEDWDPRWIAQARHSWGNTSQWTEYAERAAARTPKDWEALTDAAAALETALGEAMDAGVAPGTPEAHALAEEHRSTLGAHFTLSHEMQVCLGRKYEADPAFTAYYDRIRPGMAAWLRQIIDANARTHGIDPDTAAWR